MNKEQAPGHKGQDAPVPLWGRILRGAGVQEPRRCGPANDMAVIAQDLIKQSGRALPRMQRKAAWPVPGFGPLTRVSTSFGEVPAQALRERDMVRTDAGDVCEITEIDRMKLDGAFLAGVPDANPVVVRAGALGAGLPKADITVSAGQIIGTGRHLSEARFFRAGDLVGLPGIVRRPEGMMTYTNFACARPVTVQVEGIWANIA